MGFSSLPRDKINMSEEWFLDDAYVTYESKFQDVPIVHITKKDHKQLSTPWINCLIVKLLGKNMSRTLLKEQICRIWKLQGNMTMSDLGNHYYIDSFSNDQDYERVEFGGPWIISDYYLAIQK